MSARPCGRRGKARRSRTRACCFAEQVAAAAGPMHAKQASSDTASALTRSRPTPARHPRTGRPATSQESAKQNDCNRSGPRRSPGRAQRTLLPPPNGPEAALFVSVGTAVLTPACAMGPLAACKCCCRFCQALCPGSVPKLCRRGARRRSRRTVCIGHSPGGFVDFARLGSVRALRAPVNTCLGQVSARRAAHCDSAHTHHLRVRLLPLPLVVLVRRVPKNSCFRPLRRLAAVLAPLA